MLLPLHFWLVWLFLFEVSEDWKHFLKKVCIIISLILSNEVLLDFTFVDSVMYDTEFTYLKIDEITWDFWTSKVIQNKLKTQYKLHLAKYDNCTGHHPQLPGGIHSWKPAQAHCSLQNTFAICLALYFLLGWTTYSLPSLHADLDKKGRYLHSFNSSWRNPYICWPTQLLVAISLKKGCLPVTFVLW